MVFRTVLRISHNIDDAEDILQDAWMRAFSHIETFDGRSEFSTWVTRIAINSALTMIRMKTRNSELLVFKNNQIKIQIDLIPKALFT